MFVVSNKTMASENIAIDRMEMQFLVPQRLMFISK